MECFRTDESGYTGFDLLNVEFIHMLPLTDFEEQRRFRKSTQAAEVIGNFASWFNG